jgi:hypothetical protein
MWWRRQHASPWTLAICCTVVGLPVGLWMPDQAPVVLSSHRD